MAETETTTETTGLLGRRHLKALKRIVSRYDDMQFDPRLPTYMSDRQGSPATGRAFRRTLRDARSGLAILEQRLEARERAGAEERGDWFVFGTHPDGTVDISDSDQDVLERVPAELAEAIVRLRESTLDAQAGRAE